MTETKKKMDNNFIDSPVVSQHSQKTTSPYGMPVSTVFDPVVSLTSQEPTSSLPGSPIFNSSRATVYHEEISISSPNWTPAPYHGSVTCWYPPMESSPIMTPYRGSPVSLYRELNTSTGPSPVEPPEFLMSNFLQLESRGKILPSFGTFRCGDFCIPLVFCDICCSANGQIQFLVVFSNESQPKLIDTLDLRLQIEYLLKEIGDRWMNKDNINTLRLSDLTPHPLSGFFFDIQDAGRPLPLSKCFPANFSSADDVKIWSKTIPRWVPRVSRVPTTSEWTPLPPTLGKQIDGPLFRSSLNVRSWALDMMKRQFSKFSTGVLVQFLISFVSNDILLFFQPFLQYLDKKSFFHLPSTEESLTLIRTSTRVTHPTYLSRRLAYPVNTTSTKRKCRIKNCDIWAVYVIHPCCTQSREILPVLCRSHITPSQEVRCPVHDVVGHPLGL